MFSLVRRYYLGMLGLTAARPAEEEFAFEHAVAATDLRVRKAAAT